MADEKNIKKDELTDEQLNEASGGQGPMPFRGKYRCATPGCIRNVWAEGDYCDHCVKIIENGGN